MTAEQAGSAGTREQLQPISGPYHKPMHEEHPCTCCTRRMPTFIEDGVKAMGRLAPGADRPMLTLRVGPLPMARAPDAAGGVTVASAAWHAAKVP